MDAQLVDIKKEFAKYDLSSTYLPEDGLVRVGTFEDLREQCVDQASKDAEIYLRKCLKACSLDIETLTVSKGLICLTVVGFTPIEVRHFLRKSRLYSVSKATKECLEIDASNYDIALKDRMKSNQATALNEFKKALKRCIEKGLLSSGSSVKKEFDPFTGNVQFFIDF